MACIAALVTWSCVRPFARLGLGLLAFGLLFPAYAARHRTTVPTSPPGTPTFWAKDSGISGSPIDSIANSGSAGGSVANTGSQRPSVGTIDSKSVAVYDGGDDRLHNGPTLSSVIGASAYTVGCVFSITSLYGGGGTAGYDLPALLSDGIGGTGGNWYPLIVDGTGLRGGHYNAGDFKTTAIALSTGVVYVAIAKYDGSTFSLTVNGSTQSVSISAGCTRTQPLRMGANYASAAFLNGKIAETVVYDTALSAGDATTLDGYLRGRFPSAT